MIQKAIRNSDGFFFSVSGKLVYLVITMKKLSILFSAVGSLVAASVLTSCGCCTGEEAPPALRPAPVFEPIEAPAAPMVEPAK